MSIAAKLGGKEPLWYGDPWLDLGRGPRLPPPWFWVGIAIGIVFGALVL